MNHPKFQFRVRVSHLTPGPKPNPKTPDTRPFLHYLSAPLLISVSAYGNQIRTGNDAARWRRRRHYQAGAAEAGVRKSRQLEAGYNWPHADSESSRGQHRSQQEGAQSHVPRSKPEHKNRRMPRWR